MNKIVKTIKYSAILLLFPLLSQADEATFYSLQVKALPIAEQKQGLELYETLKQTGYLVYYYSAEVDGKEWLRIRVGHFSNKEQAKQTGEAMKKTKGIGYFIDKAELFVDHYQNQLEVITSPSAIWLKTANQTKEIYHFNGFNGLDLIKHTQAIISPSGKEIVFYYDHQLLRLEIDSGKSQTLTKDGLLDSQPAWSADGKYIGYLDYSEWETPTSLCIIAVETAQNTCLVKNNEKTQKAVKSFYWHPRKNLLFFVEGPAYGTVSVGGNLYSVDLKGHRKEMVTAKEDHQEEVATKFSIKNDTITYTVVQFDKAYTKPTTSTTHQIKIE